MHVSPEPAITAITDQFRRAGFPALTPLQRRLVPAIFRGRDLAAETAQGSGGTAAAAYTLIIGYRGRSPAPVGEGAAALAVLIAADTDEVGQVAREWARFAKALGRAPSFAAVGDAEDARREQRRLGAGAAVVAGTPVRIIDHLRRGSLRLEALETLIISLPEGEARESFMRDVQFVLEKCPGHRQTVLLGRPPLEGQDEVLALAHHPEIVTAAGPAELVPLREALDCDGTDRDEALARLLLALPAAPVLVLHGGRSGGERTTRRLQEVGVRSESLPPGSAAPARRRALASLAAGTRDALLVPLPVPDDLDLDDAACVVWLDLPQPRDARRALPARGRLIALVGANQAKDFAKLQESIGVTMKTLEMPGDADVLGGALDRIVEPDGGGRSRRARAPRGARAPACAAPAPHAARRVSPERPAAAPSRPAGRRHSCRHRAARAARGGAAGRGRPPRGAWGARGAREPHRGRPAH